MEELIERIEDNFTETELHERFDEFILEYVDYDQMERRDIDTEYEWYVRFGTGEAERDVRHWMADRLDFQPDSTFKEAARIAFPDAPV